MSPVPSIRNVAAKQADLQATTVTLLDEILSEMRRSNELTQHTNALIQWLGETMGQAKASQAVDNVSGG